MIKLNNKYYYKQIINKIASESNINNNQIPSIKGYEKRLEKIVECGSNKNLLTISYVDRKGNRTKRMVEPYKLTDTDFWAYDTTTDGIRRFKNKNIKGIKKSIKTFEPRWEIEINN